jgi:hypothetical protein
MWSSASCCSRSSLVLAMVAIRYALATISGFDLVYYCLAAGLLAWRWLYWRFAMVLPQIVQGSRRAATAVFASGWGRVCCRH